MWMHENISQQELHSGIRRGNIRFAGNKALRIYGLLSCWSGRKMKNTNRVFFQSEEEAMGYGYRPCGHCLKNQYTHWKKNLAK